MAKNPTGLPTYRTCAAVLERKNDSGLALAGWTVARAALVMPGFLLVGNDLKRSVVGSLIVSSAMSALVLFRVFNAKYDADMKHYAKNRR